MTRGARRAAEHVVQEPGLEKRCGMEGTTGRAASRCREKSLPPATTES